MSMFKAFIVLALFSLSAIAAESALSWRGYEFQEIDSLRSLPSSVRRQLGAELPGLRGIADKGMPFNITDDVDSSKPMRRFLTAGQSGDTWLVALEQGGRGYSVQVYLFTGDVQQQHWALLGRPTTLQSVIQQLPAASTKNED